MNSEHAVFTPISRCAAVALVALFAMPLGAAAADAVGVTWISAGAQDGAGGLYVYHDENRLVYSDDDCPGECGDSSSRYRPQWLVFGTRKGRSLDFSWRWVTHKHQKYWEKRWGMFGMALNENWDPVDVRQARFLVFSVKAVGSEDIDLKVSLIDKDKNQTGEVLATEWTDKGRLGSDWTPVFIPLERFPKFDEIDQAKIYNVSFGAGGQYPENEQVHALIDNVYFTSTKLVPGVRKVGYLVLPDEVILRWEPANADTCEGFEIKADGTPLGTLPANVRATTVAGSRLRGPTVELSIAAVEEGKQSAPTMLDIQLAPKATEKADVTVLALQRHMVSKYIFGVNNMAPDLATQAGATINRWGGNITTRYNWRDDVHNAGSDWFFLGSPAPPADQKENEKSYFRFIEGNLKNKIDVNVCISAADWIARRPEPGGRLCSFPTSVYPNQNSSDGEGAGDGLRVGTSEPIWDNDPAIANVPNSPEIQKEWLRTIVRHFGKASDEGVRFYSIDNEPGIWHITHRDVHPRGVGYDELLRRNLLYMKAIRSVDPEAKLLGYSSWGVMDLAGSALDFMPPDPEGYRQRGKRLSDREKWSDRRQHGDVPLVAWYLQKMREAERAGGQRLLDVLDIHWYPEIYEEDSKGVGHRIIDDVPHDPKFTEKQFESLREWWDPTYLSSGSWTANRENRAHMWEPFHPIIPALQGLCDRHYPGTKVAITEFATGSAGHYHGGLLRIATLGIFMRENLYMANNWYGTTPDDYVFWAYRMFTNYDGKGASVIGRYTDVQSPHEDVFAFATTQGNAVFAILINKNAKKPVEAVINLPAPKARAVPYYINETLGPCLQKGKPLNIGGTKLECWVPAFSAVMLECR